MDFNIHSQPKTDPNTFNNRQQWLMDGCMGLSNQDDQKPLYGVGMIEQDTREIDPRAVRIMQKAVALLNASKGFEEPIMMAIINAMAYYITSDEDENAMWETAKEFIIKQKLVWMANFDAGSGVPS